MTADSGFCSDKNMLYLKEKQITSYIMRQGNEKQKARAYQEDIGKYYNMRYVVYEDEHYYICHDTGENCVISVRKVKNRTAIHRPFRCMYVRTVAVVSINPDVCINTMQRKARSE